MRTAVVVSLIIGAAIIVSTLLMRPTAQRYVSGFQKVEKAVSLLETVQPYLQVNTEKIDAVMEQAEQNKQVYQRLLTINKEQQAIIDSLEKQLSEIPDIEVPEIDYTPAEDYSDCLEKLKESRQTSEKLSEALDARNRENALLRAQNLSQGIVIESKKTIIKMQSEDFADLVAAYDEFLQTSNRAVWIGSGIGALGLALAIFL